MSSRCSCCGSGLSAEHLAGMQARKLKILQVNLVMSILLYVMVLVYLYGIQATNMDSSRQEQQQSSPDPVNSLITQLLQADLTRGKTRVNQSQQERSREMDLRDTLPHPQDENFPSEERVDVETLENDDQLVMLLNSELFRKQRRYSSSRVLLSEHPPLHPPPLYPSDDFVSGVMERSPSSNKARKKRDIKHRSYSAEFSVCDSKSEWVKNKTDAVDDKGNRVTVLRTFTGPKGKVFSQYFYETYCNPSKHNVCRGIDNKNWNSKCKTTQTYVRAFTQTNNRPSWTWIRINTSCVCALSKKRRKT
uniref:Neurotrophin-3 n=1 Tax=Oryzias sinensis TaxID=183150 RepID=A0A8C7XW77_9TELE